MSKSFTDRFSGAGSKISETFTNIGGQQLANNTIHGSVILGVDSKRDRCHDALIQGISHPTNDRDVIKRFLRKQNKVATDLSPKMFGYILNIAKFKTWRNMRTHSQLLWICGGTGLGKTPLTLFLINEFEKTPDQADGSIMLYYFCDSKNHTRNHPVSVIRGLMLLLITARPELIDVLMPDFENQRDSLFSHNPSALEALWKNFVNMARDPRAGRVFCIIDGIDQCVEEPLDHLLDIIKEFYEGEEEQYKLRQTHNAHPATQQQPGAALQMLLISREAPKCISDALEGFPRIPLKKETKRPTNKPTKLAAIAREALRRETAKTTKEFGPASVITTSLSSESSTQVHPPPNSNQKRQLCPNVADTVTHTQTNSDEGATSNVVTVIPSGDYSESKRDASSAAAAVETQVLVASTTTQENVAELSSVSTFKNDQQNSPDDCKVKEGDTKPVASMPVHTEYVFDELAAEAEIEFEEDIEEGNDSVAIYIEERVAILAKERGYSTALSSKLFTGLEERGDGTFLWVDLAIEEIMRYQPQDAELVLAELPGDPNDLYCRTLQKIPQNLISLAIAILRWVLAARRPLMIHELGAALVLLNYQSFDTRTLTLQGISACGSMLTVEEDDTVHITHNSVKDLLTSDSSPLRTNASLFHFYVHLGETDSEIASLCIQYLERGCLQEGAMLPADGQEKYFKHVAQYPLFPYAVEFWPSHLREATRPQINLDSPFFIKTSAIRKHWWLTYWPATTGKWGFLAPKDFTLLHIASYLDLPFLAQQLILKGELRHYLETHDNHGFTPIYYAAERGHLNTFVLLLQQGAKTDDVYGTIFETAASKGQAQIVEHLIKQGQPVDTRARDVSTMEALKHTTKYFKGVLNEGISTDRDQWKLMTKDTGQGGTALHHAALYGHVSVMEVLLKWNADVRVTTTKNWTPLHASSWTGQTECVKLLLEKGADATAMTDFGWMPYHCAASRGKTAVIELYLKLGMPVDTMTRKQKTALHLAAWAGNAATVRTLVSFGAAVDLQSYKGETPLHLAARHSKPEIVELLLSSGANKHIINKNGLPVSDILRNIQGGGTDDQREMLRILDQFGMPGYTPWQPKTDATTATQTAVQPTGLAPTSQEAYQRRHSTSSTLYMTQPASDSKITQPPLSQQPTFALNAGFQQPSLVQSGTTIQLNLASSRMPQEPVKMESTAAPALNLPSSTDSFAPPPPYSPASNTQSSQPSQSGSEKQQTPSAYSISVPQAPSFPQPPSTPSVQTTTKLEDLNVQGATGGAIPSSPHYSAVLHTGSASSLTAKSQQSTLGSLVSDATAPSHAQQPSGQQTQYSPSGWINQQSIQPQPGQSLAVQPQVPVPKPLQTPASSPPFQSPPTTVQIPQPIISQPQLTQPQPMQNPIVSFPSQHMTISPIAPPSPLLQPVSGNMMPGLQQQFSQISLSPSPISPSPIPQQGHIQNQQQLQQQPPQFYTNQSPNFNANTQAYSQNTQLQYSQQFNPAFQQYPVSPLTQGSQSQQFQAPQSASFLSVGIGVPSGVFGGQNGNMGSAMAFAPPPQQQGLGFQKKKSFRNLGGILK